MATLVGSRDLVGRVVLGDVSVSEQIIVGVGCLGGGFPDRLRHGDVECLCVCLHIRVAPELRSHTGSRTEIRHSY